MGDSSDSWNWISANTRHNIEGAEVCDVRQQRLLARVFECRPLRPILAHDLSRHCACVVIRQHTSRAFTNPTHRPLEGVVTDKGVELRCLDCEYRQTKIPDAVLRAHPIDDPRR